MWKQGGDKERNIVCCICFLDEPHRYLIGVITDRCIHLSQRPASLVQITID